MNSDNIIGVGQLQRLLKTLKTLRILNVGLTDVSAEFLGKEMVASNITELHLERNYVRYPAAKTFLRGAAAADREVKLNLDLCLLSPEKEIPQLHEDLLEMMAAKPEEAPKVKLCAHSRWFNPDDAMARR